MVERLDKLVAHRAGLTRSEARRYIRAGLVCVDGSPLRDGAQAVPMDARVTLSDTPLLASGPRYLMLHKPLGVVCDRSNGHHRSVFDLVPDSTDLHVAGRLDADTTGLVVLTDDGAWSHRLTAPRHKQAKVYRVVTARPIGADAPARFLAGIQLHGESSLTRPATLECIDDHHACLTLQEGRYHQVKRMFAALGNHVTALHRESIGGIRLDPTLNPGDWRDLTHDEIHPMSAAL